MKTLKKQKGKRNWEQNLLKELSLLFIVEVFFQNNPILRQIQNWNRKKARLEMKSNKNNTGLGNLITEITDTVLSNSDKSKLTFNAEAEFSS